MSRVYGEAGEVNVKYEELRSGRTGKVAWADGGRWEDRMPCRDDAWSAVSVAG